MIGLRWKEKTLKLTKPSKLLKAWKKRYQRRLKPKMLLAGTIISKNVSQEVLN